MTAMPCRPQLTSACLAITAGPDLDSPRLTSTCHDCHTGTGLSLPKRTLTRLAPHNLDCRTLPYHTETDLTLPKRTLPALPDPDSPFLAGT